MILRHICMGNSNQKQAAVELRRVSMCLAGQGTSCASGWSALHCWVGRFSCCV